MVLFHAQYQDSDDDNSLCNKILCEFNQIRTHQECNVDHSIGDFHKMLFHTYLCHQQQQFRQARVLVINYYQQDVSMMRLVSIESLYGQLMKAPAV